MRKLNLIFICILFVLIIFFSGCVDENAASSSMTPDSGEGSEETEDPNNLAFTPYIGGDKALNIGFHQMMDRIPKDIAFPIIVRLSNEGEYTIDRGDATLILLSANLWNKESNAVKNNSDKNIRGKELVSGEEIPGDSVILTYDNCIYKGVQDKAIPPSSLRVQACYPYKTFAKSEICALKSADYRKSLEGDSSYCDPTGDKKVYSSGAPLQVTDVRQFYSSPGKAIIQIKVEKITDSGTIYDGSPGDCSGEINRVAIENIRASDPSVTYNCSANSIFLMDNEGKIICTLENLNSESSYREPIEITLSYMYKEILTKEIQVFSEMHK